MRGLGENQKGVLRTMRQEGNCWHQGCGWDWAGLTDKICDTLVVRGLATKIALPGYSWKQQYRYDLTETGKTIDASPKRYPFDDDPPEQKLGYHHQMEKAAIRSELVADGATDDLKLYFMVETQYIENHRDDPSLPQRQAAARAAKPEKPVYTIFTTDELKHLVALFADANDLLSESISKKAAKLLTISKEPNS